MLWVKYLVEILPINYFKDLEYYFEVRDINAYFLKNNYLCLRYFDNENFELNYI